MVHTCMILDHKKRGILVFFPEQCRRAMCHFIKEAFLFFLATPSATALVAPGPNLPLTAHCQQCQARKGHPYLSLQWEGKLLLVLHDAQMVYMNRFQIHAASMGWLGPLFQRHHQGIGVQVPTLPRWVFRQCLLAL